MAENKTKPTQKSVAEFIDALTDETKRADANTLVALFQKATGEEPQMWGPSIVGFGSYHYKYESGREGDMPLVGFSLRTTAIVLYGLNSASDAETLIGNLGRYTRGKGCIYVKKLADVDPKVLKEIVVKSVNAKRSGIRTEE